VALVMKKSLVSNVNVTLVIEKSPTDGIEVALVTQKSLLYRINVRYCKEKYQDEDLTGGRKGWYCMIERGNLTFFVLSISQSVHLYLHFL